MIVPPIKASDLMRGTTIVVHMVVIHDWRSRLGLRVMKLGARIMRGRIEDEKK